MICLTFANRPLARGGKEAGMALAPSRAVAHLCWGPAPRPGVPLRRLLSLAACRADLLGADTEAKRQEMKP